MLVQSLAKMIAVWNVDIYAGWSIMDVVGLMFLLLFVVKVVNYFFFKAST